MIRAASKADMPEIRALWEVCFPDDTGFNDYYFTHIFTRDTTILYELDGRIAAMVQMLPYVLHAQGETVSATYIYGACTHPDFRRRHLMSELLEWSFAQDIQNGVAATMLIPQEKWLFDFYRPFGYQPAFALGTAAFSEVLPVLHKGLRPMTPDDLPACEMLYRTKTADCPLVVARTSAQWKAQLSLFEVLGAGAFVLELAGKIAGYAFVWNEENGIWAQELMCLDEAAQDILISALAARTAAAHVRVSVPDSNGTLLGCIKWYGEISIPQNGYMNLMYN